MKLSRRVRMRVGKRRVTSVPLCKFVKAIKDSCICFSNRQMEHLKEIIAEYAIPQAKLEARVEQLTGQVERLQDTVDRLHRLCGYLQAGYDASECCDGHLVGD
jgi:hypothetical protein